MYNPRYGSAKTQQITLIQQVVSKYKHPKVQIEKKKIENRKQKAEIMRSNHYAYLIPEFLSSLPLFLILLISISPLYIFEIWK
jgi:hypothetical protein